MNEKVILSETWANGSTASGGPPRQEKGEMCKNVRAQKGRVDFVIALLF